MCQHRLSRRHILRMIPGLALVGAGCGQPSSGPVAVNWGRDTCDYCGMVIDNPNFAAQVRSGANGKVYKFDDIGDGVLFLVKQDWANDPKNEFWVGSMETGKWIDGFKAQYVSGQKTPMAHGFGAIEAGRPGSLPFDRFKGAVIVKGPTTRCEPVAQTEARG